MFVTKLTKQDKEMLRAEFTKVWHDDTKMVDFCVKKTSAYMVVDGMIITIDKPSIETRFCFGWGSQGAYDYDEAQATCSKMSQSERYFVDYNLSHSLAGEILYRINSDQWIDYWVTKMGYSMVDADCRLGAIRCENRSMPLYLDKTDWRKLTEDELAEYKQMLEAEIEKFHKRLNTYLKRYGLSKCSYWTYWVDE